MLKQFRPMQSQRKAKKRLSGSWRRQERSNCCHLRPHELHKLKKSHEMPTTPAPASQSGERSSVPTMVVLPMPWEEQGSLSAGRALKKSAPWRSILEHAWTYVP